MVDQNGWNALACASMGAHNNNGALLNYIAEQLVRLPSIPDTFTMPEPAVLNLAAARAVGRLLSKLKRLKCLCRHATQEGMEALLQSLKEHALTHVTLTFPRSLAQPISGLRRIERSHRVFLKDNTALEYLCYQGGWYKVRDTDHNDDALFLSLLHMPRKLPGTESSLKHFQLSNCRLTQSTHLCYLLTDYSMPHKVTFQNLSVAGPWKNPNRMAALSIRELQFINVQMERSACDAFGFELRRMRNLRRLSLALPFADHFRVGATVVTERLLKQGLEYLCLDYDIKVDIVQLSQEALSLPNSQLKELHVPQALATAESRKALAKTLQHSNTCLQHVTLDKRDKYCQYARWIRLLTHLNRLGRGTICEEVVSVADLVQLLITASSGANEYATKGLEDEKLLNVTYQLLHEAPSLWSSSSA
jgi:hypothetical protein